MMTDPPQLRRGKLSDQVRQQLLEHIQSQAVRPGDALPSERELMERLGVGRPAIREAMQDLQRTGLIEIRHGERARVAEPSMGRMVEQVSETMNHFLFSPPASLEKPQGSPNQPRAQNGPDRRTNVRRRMTRATCRSADRGEEIDLAEFISGGAVR
jgi:DNA-binding transcriptional regulator YhcF (GntR family)